MRKIILSAAAIAVSFAVFAFVPVEKNNATENAIISDLGEWGAFANCSTKYKTETTFSECNNTHEQRYSPQLEDEKEVLNKY